MLFDPVFARVARMRPDAPFNAPDMATFYVPGAKGYADYPVMARATIPANPEDPS